MKITFHPRMTNTQIAMAVAAIDGYILPDGQGGGIIVSAELAEEMRVIDLSSRRAQASVDGSARRERHPEPPEAV